MCRKRSDRPDAVNTRTEVQLRRLILFIAVVAGFTFLYNANPTSLCQQSEGPGSGATQVSERKGKHMARAKARHILVPSEETCEELKAKIESGDDFAEIAREYSQCPSGKQGGGLGEFSPGQMVPEFDEVVFSSEIGKVQGPVKTDFGYHLIEVTDRTE